MGPYQLSTLEPETEALFICLKNAYLFQNWGSKTCNFRLHNTVHDSILHFPSRRCRMGPYLLSTLEPETEALSSICCEKMAYLFTRIGGQKRAILLVNFSEK